jgi:serpin B
MRVLKEIVMSLSGRLWLLAWGTTILAIFTGGPGLLGQGGTAKVTDLSAIASSNNQFAFDFYRSINAADEGKNIFVSPFSVSTALAMTFEGSRGTTRKQMAGVLHFNLTDADRQAGFSALLAEINDGQAKQYTLEVANALWGQKGFHVEPSFTATVGKFYGGGFYAVDFVGDKAGSVQKINTWVDEKTAGKIKDLVHPGDVNEVTRLILTNAIYFKGTWAAPFERIGTRTEPFHTSATASVQAPMMHRSGQFRFAKEDALTAIELPYAGNEMSMIAILPGGDIDKLGESLSNQELDRIRKEMRPEEVEVSLPRFKIEARSLLKDNLSKLGMPDGFDKPVADFSGITGNKALYLSSVIHQAMIDVNEEGSEAAAATGVVIKTRTVRAPSKLEFRADRPFIFMIVHNPSGSILFMGRLTNPLS